MNVAYVNGQYLPRLAAATSIEDRGYQFADGVYEVLWLKDGVLIDEAAHLDRLKRSLKALAIAMPMEARALRCVVRELVRRNRAQRGDYLLYLQVTRGVARRNHLFPKSARPSLVMTLTRFAPPAESEVQKGVKAITHPDIRWSRCDIKSVALLPNILARQTAADANAREAILVDAARGVITEGSATNIFIIYKGVLRTHPADTHILNGITRLAILALAQKLRIKTEERAFTLAELHAADEVFISSTSAAVLPVSQVDGKKIKTGPIARKLYAAYSDYIKLQ